MWKHPWLLYSNGFHKIIFLQKKAIKTKQTLFYNQLILRSKENPFWRGKYHEKPMQKEGNNMKSEYKVKQDFILIIITGNSRIHLQISTVNYVLNITYKEHSSGNSSSKFLSIKRQLLHHPAFKLPCSSLYSS